MVIWFPILASPPSRTMPDPESPPRKVCCFVWISVRAPPLPYSPWFQSPSTRLSLRPIRLRVSNTRYSIIPASHFRTERSPMLIRPAAYRLEATHDLSPLLLSDFFFPSLGLRSLQQNFGSQYRVKAVLIFALISMRQRHAPLRNHRHHCSTCTFFFLLLHRSQGVPAPNQSFARSDRASASVPSN